jgi:hypothetical protein
MMHPTISEALARSRQQQFRREAEQWRLARSRAGVRARPGRPAAAVTGLATGLASRALRVTAVLVPAPIRVHGALPGDDAGLVGAAAAGRARASGHGTCARPRHPPEPSGISSVVVPARAMTMCQHQPPCPPAGAPDHAAARTVASHPEQGWSLLCNRVVLFDDGGELLPGGRAVEPPRPLGETGIQPSRRRPIPAELQILAAIPA